MGLVFGFWVFFTEMHKYFYEPSVVHVTNGTVCHSRHTCVCISLTVTGRFVTGDRGAASQLASLSSCQNPPTVPASRMQSVKGRQSPLLLTLWSPNELSDLSFLHVRKVKGLLYITCFTLNLYSFNELCFSYTTL